MARPSKARWIARVLLPLGFILLVGVLLATQLREVTWSSVVSQLRAYSGGLLFCVGMLAAASYLVYSLYDLIGRHQLRHGLPRLKVMAIAFVSYVFNLNLGALVGGIAFRYRLYARAGLKPAQTTQVLGLSLVTNWLGYMALAGGIFVIGTVRLPESWAMGTSALQVLGGVLLACAFLYLLLCAAAKRRTWTVRRQKLRLPSWPVALVQLLLSVTNWLLMGSMVFLLLDQRAPFPVVLGVLLLSSLAGIIVRIPAGLGVIETVFLAILGASIGRGEVLAALLAYRGIYYLAPLLFGTAAYLVLEARATAGQRQPGNAVRNG